MRSLFKRHGTARHRPARGEGRSGPSPAAIYSAVVSTLAFLGSAFSIYYTTLRTPSVVFMHGTTAVFEYLDGEPLYISIPVVMANVGARPAIVASTDLVLQDTLSGKGIVLHPRGYKSADVESLKFVDYPSPEILNGGEKIKRIIEYSSRDDWQKTLGKIAPRRYKITIRAATELNREMVERDHLFITPDAEALDSGRVTVVENVDEQGG